MRRVSVLILMLLTVGYSSANSPTEYNIPTDNGQYGGIAISDVWIRQAPPNAQTLALFMTVHNLTYQTINIIDAEAQGYARAELHRTLNDNSVMKMLKQSVIPIAAGESLLLQPGSWHIMLINPETTPKLNERVLIRLTLDNHSSIVFPATITTDHSAAHSH